MIIKLLFILIVMLSLFLFYKKEDLAAILLMLTILTANVTNIMLLIQEQIEVKNNERNWN